MHNCINFVKFIMPCSFVITQCIIASSYSSENILLVHTVFSEYITANGPNIIMISNSIKKFIQIHSNIFIQIKLGFLNLDTGSLITGIIYLLFFPNNT